MLALRGRDEGSVCVYACVMFAGVRVCVYYQEKESESEVEARSRGSVLIWLRF